MMTTNSTGATVISLQTHPAWGRAQRRSQELAAAMRRHPSYQSAPAADTAHDAVVQRFQAR